MSADHLEHYTVRSYEVETDGRLRPVVLLRMLQETAWHHARLLGKGFSQREHGELFWVLARLRVRMEAYPAWGERFTIRTFPVGTDRLLAIREFEIIAEERVLGRAWSGWLILDGGAGRPLRPQPVVADIETLPGVFEGGTGRLPALGETAPVVHNGTALHHDIDQYRHVNNAAYLEWALDSRAPDHHERMMPATIELDFLRETTHGVSFSVVREGGETNERFEIRHGDGTVAVRGGLGWVSVEGR